MWFLEEVCMAGRVRGKRDLNRGRNLTVAGYCKIYGGHPDVVRAKARLGEIPFKKPDGVWLISPEAAEAHQYGDDWKDRQEERKNILEAKRLHGRAM
jgi:hypothetical protein